jgi:hypothetical protein
VLSVPKIQPERPVTGNFAIFGLLFPWVLGSFMADFGGWSDIFVYFGLYFGCIPVCLFILSLAQFSLFFCFRYSFVFAILLVTWF